MIRSRRRPPIAPLTPAVVRRLVGWSQVRVAGLAGTTPSTVRVYELAPKAVQDVRLRRALEAVYAMLRRELLGASRSAA